MLDQALLDPLLSPAFLGLVGLCVGSFLNVVIYRLPVMLHREWLSDCADQLAIESDLRTHAWTSIGIMGASVRAACWALLALPR